MGDCQGEDAVTALRYFLCLVSFFGRELKTGEF